MKEYFKTQAGEKPKKGAFAFLKTTSPPRRGEKRGDLVLKKDVSSPIY